MGGLLTSTEQLLTTRLLNLVEIKECVKGNFRVLLYLTSAKKKYSPWLHVVN